MHDDIMLFGAYNGSCLTVISDSDRLKVILIGLQSSRTTPLLDVEKRLRQVQTKINKKDRIKC